jgi:thiol-disulfide isomerase/thioredoxin
MVEKSPPKASAHIVPAVLLAVAFVTFVAACGSGSARPAPALVPATAAAELPPLEYALLAGGSWSSRAGDGHVLVLDVWATYCKPCRKAFPKLDALAAAYPAITVVGLSVDEEDAVVHAFLREVPATFAIARDPQRTVASGPLAIQRLPTLLLVDRHGRVRLRAEEMAEADYDALPALVAALLAEP